MINYYVSESHGREWRRRQAYLVSVRHDLFAEKHRLKTILWKIDLHLKEIAELENL